MASQYTTLSQRSKNSIYNFVKLFLHKINVVPPLLESVRFLRRVIYREGRTRRSFSSSLNMQREPFLLFCISEFYIYNTVIILS